MRKILFLSLTALCLFLVGCKRDYATLTISAPEKIVMEVGDSLLIHWDGKCPVRTTTASVYYSPDFCKDGSWRYVPDSAICYVKEVVIDGEEVYDEDVYLYAQRTGRDTLIAEMITVGHDGGTMFFYPILVVDKQSTTKGTSRINVSL